MGNYKHQSTSSGELMNMLMNERPRFASDEEFKRYAIAEVRKFITDLRAINVELSLRPTYSGQAASQYSGTQNLAR